MTDVTHVETTDREAGRAAADRLASEWPDRSWVGDAPSLDWARGAIDRFGELLRGQLSMFRASREGSERGAESLSPRPFQGILESLQNADDVRATELRLRVVRGNPDALLLAHDGDPVDLGHAGAMLLPWLTTKGDEADASGRFGIGQQTLRSLGGPIEVHCPPYHFQLTPDGPTWVEPAADVPGLYAATDRETLIRVPLGPWVDVDAILPFIAGLGGHSLLFLSHVRRVIASDTADPSQRVEHELAAEAREALTLVIRDNRVPVEWTRLADPSTGQSYDRYLADIQVSKAERRRHKAIAGTTPIGVAIPRQSGEVGGFYDRLPLPIPSAFPFSVNAQFDPDAGRQTILPIAWNERRLQDLGALTAAAAVDCFVRDPPSAWRGVPLGREVAEGVGEWLADRIRSGIVDASHDLLANNTEVTTEHGPRSLDELIFEVEELDGLLTSADQERLRPGRSALPLLARDEVGRWRDVVRDLGRSLELDVEAALDLFDLEDDALGAREPSWFVAFANAAIEADVSDDLFAKRSILLANGDRIEAPWRTDPRTLVARSVPGGLGEALGIAFPVHAAYLEPTDAARRVQATLQENGSLIDDISSPSRLFGVLSRPRPEGMDPVRLDDARLVGLRDAFETLEDDRQRDIGPKVGMNIELRGYWFDERANRQAGWVRPVEAYLPTAINRETGSFARAAGATVGLRWIDSSYARTLKRAGGRKELGPQKVLTKLGAATQPRLVRPPNEFARYVGVQHGSPVSGVSRPAIQLREIRAIRPPRTYLLDDRWSPDLDAVVADIARDRVAKRRRARGLVLLGVLARAWERHYSEYQSAQAVYEDYTWRDPKEVISTWLARAAETPWLPGKSGPSRSPMSLLLPTDANHLAYGADSPLFLAAVDDAILRSPIIGALRIRRGPAVSSLVATLRELTMVPVTKEVSDEVRGIYRLLALAAPADGRGRPVDDLSVAEFRNAFAAGPGKPGLILAGTTWLDPTEVLSGPLIFGPHRPFAPHSPALRSLWRLLRVPEPTAADCIGVLRDLALAPLASDDVGVVLETLRALAALLPQTSPQLRVQIGRIPLWTSKGWIRTRPVFAIDDPTLAAEVGDQVATWEHGFTSFAGLEDLIAALRVTVIHPEDFVPAAPTAFHKVDGDRIRPRFAAAVGHLRDELARGDQALHDSISVPWPDLLRADVFIDPDLALTWTAHGGATVTVPAQAHMSRGPLRLLARSDMQMGLAEAAGIAIASLFEGDRQKVAWAWASMWQRAEAGQTPAGVILSEQGGEDDEGATARLLRLQGEATGRRGRGGKAVGRSAKGGGTRPSGPVIVRTLKDISELEPNEGAIINVGRTKPGIIFPASSMVTRPEPGAPPAGAGAIDGDPGAGTDQTGGTSWDGKPVAPVPRQPVLPHVDEREQLAFDAVQAALSLNRPEILDLRARRGVGADAMDDLRQLYEIKMASGEIANEITLTKTEAEAAQDPDFFLALVAGLEDNDVPLSVRFIFDPLRTLSQRITGDVTLSGLREVEALEYTFHKPEGPSES